MMIATCSTDDTVVSQCWALSERQDVCFEYVDESFKVLQYSRKDVFASAWRLVGAMGLQRGEVVGVAMRNNSIELLVSQIAVMTIGCCFVPLDLEDPRWTSIVADCRPKVVLYADDSGWSGTIENMLEIGSGLNVTEILALGNLQLNRERIAAVPKDTISHIYYTSGTTGRPKGVVVKHGSLLAFVQGKRERSQISTESRMFLASSLTFDPNLGDTFVALCAGARLCSAHKKHIIGGNLSRAMELCATTHVCLTPTVWMMRGDKIPETLQEVSLGGEPMSDKLLADWEANAPKHIRLVNIYGVTEGTVYQSTFVVNDPENISRARKLIGIPYRGMKLGLEFENGEVEWMNQGTDTGSSAKKLRLSQESMLTGEIIIGGPQVAEGYHRLPELTYAKFFNHDGVRCYRTGDLGRWREDRNRNIRLIELIGRKDTQVKYRGVRIELGEIEESMKKCEPIVDDIAVVLKDNTYLLAFYIPTSFAKSFPYQSRCTEVALTEFAKAHLPGIMVPSRFFPVDSFSNWVNRNGKLDRKALVDSIDLETILKLGPLIPFSLNMSNNEEEKSTELEQLIGDMWGKRLELVHQHIGPYDSFMNLGGDSLDAQRICQDLVKLAYNNNPEDEQCKSLWQASNRYGELKGGFEPYHLGKSESLRAYCQHLEQCGLAQFLGNSNETMEQEDAIISVKNRAVYVAVSDGNLAVMKVLLDPQFQVHCSPDGNITRERRGKTPLHLAASIGNVDALQLLLNYGANVFATTSENVPAPHIAAAFPGEEGFPMVRAIVETMKQRNMKGISKVRDGRRQTLLHAASRGGNPATVKYILALIQEEKGQNGKPDRYPILHTLDRWHRTALHWAVLNNHVEVVKLLLEEGANPNPKVKDSVIHRSTHLPYESPLELAIRTGKDARIVEMLKSKIG